LIAFAFAVPAPSDETIVAEISGNEPIKAEDVKEILLLLKKKLLLG
jgi:hypothetical protein